MTGTQAHTRRGGAPVGYIDELDAVGAGAVKYLRMWSDGPEADKGLLVLELECRAQLR